MVDIHPHSMVLNDLSTYVVIAEKFKSFTYTSYVQICIRIIAKF